SLDGRLLDGDGAARAGDSPRYFFPLDLERQGAGHLHAFARGVGHGPVARDVRRRRRRRDSRQDDDQRRKIARLGSHRNSSVVLEWTVTNSRSPSRRKNSSFQRSVTPAGRSGSFLPFDVTVTDGGAANSSV